MDYPDRFLLKMCRNHLNNMTHKGDIIGKKTPSHKPPNLKKVYYSMFFDGFW